MQDITKLVLAGSLFVGVFSGLDYLGREHRIHLQRMENDPIYQAEVLKEREQEEQELRKLNSGFVEAWTDKHRIPGLDYLIDYFIEND